MVPQLKDKKKQMSRKEAKRLRKMEQLEQESRGKTVDPQYDPAVQVCRFFSARKCSHCRGDHYGYPSQGDKIADESGQLTDVPCPLQEQFQYSYGEKRMVEMITKETIKSWTVADLKAELEAYNLPTNGVKATLIKRLAKEL